MIKLTVRFLALWTWFSGGMWKSLVELWARKPLKCWEHLEDRSTEKCGPWRLHSQSFSGEQRFCEQWGGTTGVTLWQRVWLDFCLHLRTWGKWNWKAMDQFPWQRKFPDRIAFRLCHGYYCYLTSRSTVRDVKKWSRKSRKMSLGEKRCVITFKVLDKEDKDDKLSMIVKEVNVMKEKPGTLKGDRGKGAQRARPHSSTAQSCKM